MNTLNIKRNWNETSAKLKQKYNMLTEDDMHFKKGIKTHEDLPIHERKILENIQISNYNYYNNLLQIITIISKLKGKLEIIEILRQLNIITASSYNSIQKEAKKHLILLNEK